MILVIGGSGHLGQATVRSFLAHGWPVRVMTRNPGSVADLSQQGVEIVAGDLRDPGSLQRACRGVRQVIAAAHALNGKGGNNPHTIDDQGNRDLVDAARAAGVSHFVFVSATGAASDSPVEFFRIKYRIEQVLRSSGMNYTILRPTSYMDLWGPIIGEPILKQGKATIFGRGANPINFVAVGDVAELICTVLANPQSLQKTIQAGGPENLTMNQVVTIFEDLAGRLAKKRRVPLPVLRAMSVIMRLANPTAARLIQMAIHMDTDDLRYDIGAASPEFPIPHTRFEDWARSRYQPAGHIEVGVGHVLPSHRLGSG